jgi:hypothetical protein
VPPQELIDDPVQTSATLRTMSSEQSLPLEVRKRYRGAREVPELDQFSLVAVIGFVATGGP